MAQLLNLKPGEGRLALSLLIVLAVNTMVYQIASVVGTADFLGTAGETGIPVLWLFDVVVIFVFASVFALLVDRVSQIWLLTWIFAGFALLYLGVEMLISIGVSGHLTSGMLYILADLQLSLFPLAFWSMANTTYSMAQARRLFPLIAAGSAIGSIVGSGAAAGSAALFAKQGTGTSQMLTLSALVLLLGVVLLRLAYRGREIRSRQSTSERPSLGDTLSVGFDMVNNVPLFKFLALAMVFSGIALAIIEYHFLFSVREYYDADSARMTTFYGFYQMAYIISTWLLQWLVTGRILKNADLRNAFPVLPIVLLLSVGGAGSLFLAVPIIFGGAGGRFVARVVFRGWDEPVRKAAQGLIPDERRGRVSTFLDSYLYSLSTLLVSVFLIALLSIPGDGVLTQQTVSAIYLSVAAVAVLVAVWAITRLRAHYDESLLNWRLSRSRRKSVLDDIEF